MATNYANATIGADRGQHGFHVSLDQFLARRGGSVIASRGRALKQSNAALSRPIQQRYGVPPVPLIAIWEWRRASGGSTEQNTLSAVATLGLWTAAARLFHRPALRSSDADRSRGSHGKHARLHAWRDRPDPVSCPRPSSNTAPVKSRHPIRRASSTANFLRAHGWSAGAGYQPGEAKFRSDPGMECGSGLSASHRDCWPAD